MRIIVLVMRKIKQIIRDFHLNDAFDVASRELTIPINSGKIITLMGVRRCGKTSILYNAINLLSQNISRTQILFINFEDERLNFTIDNLDLILQAYQELYPELQMKNCYFFFDEIQNISGWEKFVRRVYDSISQNIFVTGSNSKMLSSDIATSLRGRTITYEVLPLSFKEYLHFENIEVDLYSSKSLALINNRLDKFLVQGGFPEIVLLDEKFHQKVLQDYFSVLIYKDLVERFNINNTHALKFFLKRVLVSSTKQISVSKIYNDLKSSGIKVGKNILYEYLDHIENIYLSLTLEKYNPKILSGTDRKVYSIDVGLNNAISFKFSEDIGKAIENTVYLELRRRGNKLFYYSDRASECDFIINEKDKITQAIQVTYDMNNDKTKKREIKGLVNACKKFGLDKGLIVTYNQEDEIVVDGINIKIIPLHVFLLT
ncbi:MAG: ATP-binding protein [Proteobacteria bacterium]|nr:ATP-binding protein [Pseudomonadota bacterium]